MTPAAILADSRSVEPEPPVMTGCFEPLYMPSERTHNAPDPKGAGP
jgi:hypothetical protein